MQTSLTRIEAIDLLGMPAEVLDALIDSGRILCRMTGGELRIPLSQFEDFFREGLVAVYRAESSSASPAPREERPQPERERERVAPEPPLAEAAPADVPEPQPAPPPPAPIAVRPPAEPMQHDEPPDNRVAARYVPLRQLGGIFGDVKFSVLQLSATGLRIRHSEPLLPGDEAKLSFAMLRSARSVVVRARVVWTSIARAGETRFSISGLRIIEHADRLERAIEMLKDAHELQPERRSQARRATDALSMLGGVSDEEMALVTGAVQRFASDPVEASRWYSRARFALSDENVRRIAPPRQRDREEVLGIWEYLERKVDIEKITGVMRWMRAG
ncbi:MAG TPA: PilZ domain-containing protein [Thermoanaerobaculia bacterium]|nr:PilZ domain-containing protein [Thermoanaerobaculia bacterium]